VLAFVDREEDGLTSRHLKYLAALHDFGGQLGKEALVSITRTHPTILADIERDLLNRSYINLTPAGRVLTGRGRERIGKNNSRQEKRSA